MILLRKIRLPLASLGWRLPYTPCNRFSSSSKRSGAFNWVSFGLAGSLMAIISTGVYFYKDYKKKQFEMNHLRSLGKPAIGGPFDLIDQDEKPFTSKNLLGKWAILYFGFTHCPDVCPEELEKVTKVVEIIDKRHGTGKLIPVFITVDPARDTPSLIKEYLKEFSPKFIGLTGDKRAIDSVCKRYRVYYSSGPKDADSDYIVDHTIIMYLLDPEGQFCSYFGQNKSANMIADEIDTEIMKKEDKGWFSKR
ncbi:protein SCO1 homolog, mitochondrial [Tetranychus urticae]|uniref:Thioredoxin domain-containing protein n=1 Tax=Tetranychus urticae TaxID=32264 RepID=T1K605_TETUR|nr:protein SCO1 homolog, mitochondrial [Tetranychus urticae]